MQFKDFLKELGCSDIIEDRLMHHLRTLPVEAIVSASEKVYQIYSPSLRWAFQPVIEGSGGYITKAPIEKWHSGEYHEVPILTGFNTNEGAMFVPINLSKPSQFRDFFRILLPGFSSSDLDEIENLYPDPSVYANSPYVETHIGRGSQFKRLEAAYAHWAYIAPVRQTVKFVSILKPEDSKARPPAYLYHFDVGGTGHGDQGRYVTYIPSIANFSEAQKKIAGFMHAYWTSFIISGDPNVIPGYWPERPHWPSYQDSEGEKMVFGEGNDEWLGGFNKGIPAKSVPDIWAKKECEFWWSKMEIPEQ
jgi:triacylglycerol lipase